jgi:hypothetical protein
LSPPPLLAFLAIASLLVPAQGEKGEKGEKGDRTDGSRLAVYLVTFGPGPQVWERFGHNAILFRDTVIGEGPAYDYGRFSFEEKRFVLKFARGEMWYWMGREAGVEMIDRYLRLGRSVWIQELTLPPAARARLLDSLEANYARERGLYRYDYYRDNCSTRIRDMIDLVAGGAIRAALETAPSGVSYRFHTRRSLENNLLFYGGVMTALGPDADRPISKWEEAFLPMELQRHIREVEVLDPSGRLVPLVKGEIAVAESGLHGVPAQPSREPLLVSLGFGAGIGLVIALLGRLGSRRAAARRLFIVFAGLWELAAGLAALLILWFWVLSEHTVAHRNANIFQFNLLALVVLVSLSAVASGRVRGAGRAARLFAVATAVVSLAGPVVQFLTGWGQQNAEVVGLALPAHLGVAIGLVSVTGSPSLLPSEAPPAPR